MSNTIDTDFHAYLDSLTTAAVQQNFISEDKGQPYVWWQRTSANVDLTLEGSLAVYDTSYAVEIAALDIDAGAVIADTVKAGIHGRRIQQGNTLFLVMMVEDASDEYVPKSIDTDDGFNVFAFTVHAFVKLEAL